MLAEVPVILKHGKGSTRKRPVIAALHILLWPVAFSLSLYAGRGSSRFDSRGKEKDALSPTLSPRTGRARERLESLRILLIRVDGIGDLAMSAAIFPAMREKFPDAQIDLLTSNAAAPVGQLLRDAGWIDSVYTQPLLARGWKTFRALIRQLNPNHYDIAIDLRGDARNVMLMSLLGVPRRLGLFGGGFSYTLTDSLSLPMPHHQADEPAALVARLGVTDVANYPTLPISDSLRSDADAWLRDNGMVFGLPIIAMHLTAFQPSKIWPLDRFIAVAKALRDRIDAQFVIVGSSSDISAAESFTASLGRGVAIAAGQRAVIQSAAILSRCALLIGNDSGPAHLAGAVGIGVVVIFGNGTPSHYGVRGPRVALLRRVEPCDPRCDKACAVPERFCMRDVSVQQVVDAAERLLNKSL